jgi:hypothetical protein
MLIVLETWSLESQLLDICGGVEVLCKENYDYLFFHLKNLNILHKKFIGLKKSGSSNLVNLGSILNESARVISI